MKPSDRLVSLTDEELENTQGGFILIGMGIAAAIAAKSAKGKLAGLKDKLGALVATLPLG